jgi:hypothetical protein
VEPAILALHVKDEVDEAARPFSEAAIARVAVEIEKEYDGASRVVDARDALEASIARGEAKVILVRVYAHYKSAAPGRWNTASKSRELPDHRGHGSRLAMISLTEKSAAAMHESAAP